jgi:transposase
MISPPDLSRLTEAEKDALILALWTQVQVLTARVAELEARLQEPAKTPSNASLPPSQGHKANRPGEGKPSGPRQGGLGRQGGGRPLAEEPDQLVLAKAAACAPCRAALGAGDQVLHARYDKIALPPVRPVVTRVERCVGHCPCCGGTTLAPVPGGMEAGAPFGPSGLAQALCLRFTHAISDRRLTRLCLHLFALAISEGALDALFRRAKPLFDDEVAAILARLRRARLIGSDETTVRVQGRSCWNWVRAGGDPRHPAEPGPGGGGRGAGRPPPADLGLGSARRGPARPCRRRAGLPGAPAARPAPRQRGRRRGVRPAPEGARAARRPARPAAVRAEGEHPRREYRRRLERDLDAVLALQPSHGQRLRKRYLAVRGSPCAPSSSIPRHRPTTTAANAISGRW